jgi:ribonuclease HI
MQEITIYTDGSCLGNPGPGGWAAVILADGEERRYSGGERATTNNRMELEAAIQALTKVAENPAWQGAPVRVFADSQYVKNGITSWIAKWKANGWRTAAKEPVKNRDLWMRLDALSSHLPLTWLWVKGHAGDIFNEICDCLAQNEARNLAAP